MHIFVSGAGSGKTTNMAKLLYEVDPIEGKNIYCIAFTHAAVDNITEKVQKQFGYIPEYLKISTIHSFLYKELIDPFHFLLYGQHFQTITDIVLPEKIVLKNKQISELKTENCLHQTIIPEVAKWIVAGKSGEKQTTKKIRKKILLFFNSYCQKIVIDEAQDLDQNMMKILKILDDNGIQLELYGDPKQDVKGYNCFRKLIDSTENIFYNNNCYRSPALHLSLSNRLAKLEEQQISVADNKFGCLELLFESDIQDMPGVMNGYGLVYISKKNDRFQTHTYNQKNFSSVLREIEREIDKKWNKRKTETEIRRYSFYVTEQIFNSCDPKESLNYWINVKKAFDYPGKTVYARLMNLLKDSKVDETPNVLCKTIESIKGLEDEKCLFILTTDLAPYLLGEKVDDNKTKHLLYVALTRSLDKLTIFVTKEVERKYYREKIRKSMMLNKAEPLPNSII